MEAIIFIGVQASGKTTFYKERFFETHVRISLDLLRTRHRETLLLDACLSGKQPFVVDNTNPTRAERSRYIDAARSHGFRVVGYYFAAVLADCKERNEARSRDKAIPLVGLLGTYKRLEMPNLAEGFSKLFYVSLDPITGFCVAEWKDEV